MRLLEEVRYDMAFMFKYSERPKTLAARKYPDDVPEEVKGRRLQEVIDTVTRSSSDGNKRLIGTEQLVLIEGVSKRSEENMYGRSDRYTTVIVPRRSSDGSTVHPGDYVIVRVLGATASSLQGEVLRTVPHPGTLAEVN